MKILFHKRDDAQSRPGGDTRMLSRLSHAVAALGHTVEFSNAALCDLTNYDILHLSNLTREDELAQLALAAKKRGVPFVVSTLHEELPQFYSQMLATSLALQQQAHYGFSDDKLAVMLSRAMHTAPEAPMPYSQVLQDARALLVTGVYEQKLVSRQIPSTPCEIIHCAPSLDAVVDGGELFRAHFNLDSYVLCVGRIEWRKNQLMLLKAMEHMQETLVLVTAGVRGGSAATRDYEKSCRSFKRAGKTLYIDWLEEEMLASAYSGALVHALPSWWELPGLASLDAASVGTPVVVSDRGTTREYFAETATYCIPEDFTSIREAIRIACSKSTTTERLITQMRQFSWQNAAQKLVELYESNCKH